MNRHLARMLEPRFRLCFASLIIFALVSFFIQPWVAAAELAVVLVVYIQFRRVTYKRNKEVLQYVESMIYDVDAATNDSMINFPLPMALLKLETNEIIWGNNMFMSMTDTASFGILSVIVLFILGLVFLRVGKPYFQAAEIRSE